jgi:hypothetical protein
MNDAPILICYDGSADAQRAIDAAAISSGSADPSFSTSGRP